MWLIDKTITKDQASYITIKGWDNEDFLFETWPNRYNYSTIDYLFCPEFILNWKVYNLHVYYELGEAMLELKAIKLFLATYSKWIFKSKETKRHYSEKDLLDDSEYQRILDELVEKFVFLAKPKALKLYLSVWQYEVYEEKYEDKLISTASYWNFSNPFILKTIDKKWDLNVFTWETTPNTSRVIYSNKVINNNLQIPVILDQAVLFLKKEDESKHGNKISRLFNDDLINFSESRVNDISKKIEDLLWEFLDEYEVFLTFNIRWNIKKYRCIKKGNLPLSLNDIDVIGKVTRKFSSFTY